MLTGPDYPPSLRPPQGPWRGKPHGEKYSKTKAAAEAKELLEKLGG
jgi:hypothetical protein